jgi:hypothetical protein
MFAVSTFKIRTATDADEPTLARIAALDSQPRLGAPALIGEIGGVPAAALSLSDGRLVADPFKATAQLASHLRVRATGLRAHWREPAVEARMRAAVTVTAIQRPLA